MLAEGETVRDDHFYHQTTNTSILLSKRGKSISADNPPDKSWNLSSYITECGSSDKFEILLEMCQLIERRKFFRNICFTIFMKQLGNIRGRIDNPLGFMIVQGRRSAHGIEKR